MIEHCTSDFYSIKKNSPTNILQWDFEEENVQWNKLRDSQLLPQQEWPKKTKLFSNTTSGFLQKTLSGTQGCESFSSDSLIKWKWLVHTWCRVLEGNKKNANTEPASWVVSLLCFTV